jgi:hypothetical protein
LTRFNSYLRRNDPFVSISDCRGLGVAPIADAAPWVRERLFDAGVEVSPAMEDLLANRM